MSFIPIELVVISRRGSGFRWGSSADVTEVVSQQTATVARINRICLLGLFIISDQVRA